MVIIRRNIYVDYKCILCYNIHKKRGINLETDIFIDKLTDCLIERKTGNVVETEYSERIIPITSKDIQGWKFNWRTTEENGYTIYELF